MEDYAANSKRQREGLGEPDKTKEKPEKIEKVVTEAVVVQKRSFGRKVKDLISEADIKGVAKYLLTDILIPSFQHMVVDAGTKGIERVMYRGGDGRRFYGPGPRVTYNQPTTQRYQPGPGPLSNRTMAPAIQSGPRSGSRQYQDDIILPSKSEAELVLERMSDIADKYDCVTVGNLKDLLGLQSNHVDEKWGWTFVGDAAIRTTREGFLLDLPPAEPIN